MSVRLNFSRRPFKDYRPVYLTTVVAGILGILLFSLNLRDFYSFRRRAAGTRAEIARLNDSAARLEQGAADTRQRLASLRLKELQAESARLNALLREREFSWMVLLRQLEHVLPGEVFITRLSPQIAADGTVQVEIACVGKTPDSIVKTLTAFEHDPRFTHAVPLTESDPEKGAPEGFKFHLRVIYRTQERS